MKTEETASLSATPTTTTTPGSSTPATTTPATTYPTQWASTLQQSAPGSQYYSPYTSHYPQAAYATHYQAYAPPVSATAGTAGQAKQPVSYQTSTHNLGTAVANTSANNNAVDSSDIATLNDALGSAGVDLRAEEESLQQSNTSSSHLTTYPRTYDDRTRKQPPKPVFDTRFLSSTMRTIATNHKVTRIPDDAVNYLALCLRARLQDLIEGMIKAAKHRSDRGFDRPASLYDAVEGAEPTPMWSIRVRSDVVKQLVALEKIEREEETRIRKERKERAELQAAHAAALAAQAAGGLSGESSIGGVGGGVGIGGGGEDGMDPAPKKKRKKEGPGVTARNMSEDVRKKMSNAVATQAAGLGGRYAWMTSANANATAKPKPTATTTQTTTTTAATTAATTTAATNATSASTATSSWARPYIPSTKKAPAAFGTTTTSGAATTAAGAAIAAGGNPETEEELTKITMRDAMFVIERERGHGGGRGSARGWT